MTPREQRYQGGNPRRPEPTKGKRLNGVFRYRFTIVSEEGLAIHGGEGGLEIGSVVEPNLRVILDPRSGFPYIPGSSLKGKLRSTLEKIGGSYDSVGRPHFCGQASCMICVIFGSGNPGAPQMESAPTRIVVRDSPMSSASREAWQRMLDENRAPLEQKTESMSNRWTGGAVNPRTGERVLPRTEFDGEIIFRIFEKDDKDKFLKIVQDLMTFVQSADGLGSGVSRGSGKVSFRPGDTEWIPAPQLP